MFFYSKKSFNCLERGLDDGRTRTLEEVGRVFGVTRERIRQIEAKALRKLRHPSRSKQYVRVLPSSKPKRRRKTFSSRSVNVSKTSSSCSFNISEKWICLLKKFVRF
jgi:hypothetical protein